MARIKYSELVALVEQHPDYKDRIECDVPANQALYIEFDADQPRENLESETFETTEASELVIDRGRDGRVFGIEIV